MRLAQIARKVNKKPNEILEFIESSFNVKLEEDLNLKLSDEHESAIIAEFMPEEPEVEKVQETTSTKESSEPEITDSEQEEVIEEEPLEESTTSTTEVTDEVNAEETEQSDEEAVETDADPFIEREVDPDAELIKAPKVALEGIKVVGKIDLPKTKQELAEEYDPNVEIEHEPLPDADSVENEIDQLDGKTDTSDFHFESDDELLSDLEAAQSTLSQDVKKNVQEIATAKEVKDNVVEEEDEESARFKDKKGIYHFSREQRDNRQKKLFLIAEKRKLEDLKEKKKKHYEENVAKKTTPVKKKPKKKSIAEQSSDKPERKGLWGKFLNWLND